MKRVLLTILFTFLPAMTVAQIQATTEDGKIVQLNSDGTWKYLESESVTPDIVGAGDCSNLLEREVDKMTDAVTVSIKDPFIVEKTKSEGMVFYAAKRTADQVVMILGLVGSGCVDKNAEVIILFRDGSKLDMKGSNDFNCDGRIIFWLDTDDDEVGFLSNKEIEAVRAYKNKGYLDIELKPDQSKHWMQSIKCLVDASM